jgi:hypothetical protein
MRYLLCIFVFHAYLLSPLAGQTLGSLPGDTNTISYNGNNYTVTLSVRHLFYKDKDGSVNPTDDTYILEVINGYRPRIVDRINGIEPSFQLANMGGTNEQKLLVFYHAGASQYCLKIYSLDDIDVMPLKTQPVCSNKGSIRLKGEQIIVENIEVSIDDVTTLDTDTYRVAGDECKLLKGEKKVLPPEKDR